MRVTNPSLRNYHIPAFADLPRTEVLFADTYDNNGPFGAKSMSESPYNPVAPALAERGCECGWLAASRPSAQSGPCSSWVNRTEQLIRPQSLFLEKTSFRVLIWINDLVYFVDQCEDEITVVGELSVIEPAQQTK